MSYPEVTYKIGILPNKKFYEFTTNKGLSRLPPDDPNWIKLKGGGAALTKELWVQMRREVVDAVTHNTCQLALDPAYILNWNSTKPKSRKAKKEEVAFPFYEKGDFTARRQVNWETVRRRITTLQAAKDSKYADGQHVALYDRENYKSERNVNPSVYKKRNILGTATVVETVDGAEVPVCKTILLAYYHIKDGKHMIYVDVVCSNDKNGGNMLGIVESLFQPCVVELSSILSAVASYMKRGYTFGSCEMKKEKDAELVLTRLTRYLAPIFNQNIQWSKYYKSLSSHQKYAVRLLFQYNLCIEQTIHWSKDDPSVYSGEYREKDEEMCPFFITHDANDVLTDKEIEKIYDCADQGFYMSKCVDPMKISEGLEVNVEKRKGFESWKF